MSDTLSEATLSRGMEWPLPDTDLTELSLYKDGFPHSIFVALRQYPGPIFHPPTALTPGGEGFWVFSQYEDILPIARDSTRFSSQGGGDRSGGGTMIEDLPPEGGAGSAINMMDDPRHMALRRLMAPGITNNGLSDLHSVLTKSAAEAVEEAVAAGEGEFVEEIAARLPLLAVATLLGIPEEDRKHVAGWINTVLDYSGRRLGESSDNSAQAMGQLLAYAKKFVASRVAEPGNDVLSRAVSGELRDGQGALTPMEQMMVFNVVMVAGLETTRNAIAGGLLAFTEHPDQWARLRKAPELLDPALDEILRWTSPATYNRRTATCDVAVGDKVIRSGEKVTLWWASANRDERQFERPFEFDIGRRPNAHVTFGVGRHSCLGEQMAKLEMRIVISELLKRVEGFELAGEVEWRQSNKHTGLRHLPLRYVSSDA